jgi:hypothetical protein
MKTTKLFLGALVIGALVTTSCKKKGCIDEAATNFNSEAKKDDGSCTFTPDISLNGATSITIAIGATYEELGATATNKDGSSVDVTTISTVDNTKTGTYSVTYSATNENGTATAIRTVIVVIDQSTYLGEWSVNSDCGATSFPLSGTADFMIGATTSDINIDGFFSLVGGTAVGTISGNTITIPNQTINITLGDITFSGSGTMNATGTEMVINYDYETVTFLGTDIGSCTATYTK